MLAELVSFIYSNGAFSNTLTLLGQCPLRVLRSTNARYSILKLSEYTEASFKIQWIPAQGYSFERETQSNRQPALLKSGGQIRESGLVLSPIETRHLGVQRRRLRQMKDTCDMAAFVLSRLTLRGRVSNIRLFPLSMPSD